MPIKLKPKTSTSCIFSEWAIIKAYRERLCAILAFLYLRQEKNAQRVIDALEPEAHDSIGKVAENVVKKLTAPKQKDVNDAKSLDKKVRKAANHRIETSIWHRDGLLFQYISWIVARQATPNGYMTSPHVRQADKGFDGFIIELDENKEKIERIILCEDKASESPRALVTSKVWGEIKEIINGERDDEILAELTTLLKSAPNIDTEKAVQEFFWESARHFRVSITTGEDMRKSGDFSYIVKGFEDVVDGKIEKRVAGILPFSDVRVGLDLLSQEVIAKVKALSGV